MGQEITVFYIDDGVEDGVYWIRAAADDVSAKKLMEVFPEHLKEAFLFQYQGTLFEEIVATAKMALEKKPVVILDASEWMIFTRHKTLQRELIDKLSSCLPS
jgi:hypothetical protein